MSEIAVKPDAVPALAEVTILSVIERAARDPNVDIAKMERLFEMHRAAEMRQAEKAFNAAMAAAQSELEPVTRDKRNSHVGNRYADLAAIADVAVPIIARHGLALSFGTGVSPQADHIRMVCDVTHAAGFSKRYESDLPYDFAGAQGKVNKTKIQAFGSTTTYGRRYMTLLIFNIATTDDDGNAPRQRKTAAESKRDGTSETFNEIKRDFSAALNVEHLEHVAETYKDDIEAMPENWQSLLRDEYTAKRDELKSRAV